RTREGRFRVLRESVAALVSENQTDALLVDPGGSDAQQESYIRRAATGSNAQAPALEVVATESTQIDTRLPLPKAPDIPLPVPAFQQFSEPVEVTEEAARSLLVHTVNPVYPPEALAQKLHGPVVLQAVIGR